MEQEIIRKLTEELNKGITTEAQVVYLLAEIRKLLERQQARDHSDYKYLKFYCDWALHTRLTGRMAQEILTAMDSAYASFQAGMQVGDLPQSIRLEFENVAGLKYFRGELEDFLNENSMPDLDWESFVFFYLNIIQNCPLIMSTQNPNALLKTVIVTVHFAHHHDLAALTGNILANDTILYQYSWWLVDKDGKTILY